MKLINKNNILFLTVISIFVMSISGCATVTKDVPVYKTNTIYISPPDTLLKSCDVPLPPDKTNYLTLNYTQKEDVLSNYISLLLTSIGNCNEQLKNIQLYVDNQKNIQENKPIVIPELTTPTNDVAIDPNKTLDVLSGVLDFLNKK